MKTTMSLSVDQDSLNRLMNSITIELKDIGEDKVNLVAEEVESQLKENHGTLMSGMLDIKESTKEMKRKKGQTDKPLVATGRMKDSIKIFKRATKGDLEAIISTTSKIAQYHELGFIHNRSHKLIQPRPVWRLTMVSRRLNSEINNILAK